MGFSKKVQTVTGGGSSISNEEWGIWNETEWNLLPVTEQKLPNGRLVKEVTAIGVLNYIQELGCLPQADASMKSNIAFPKEGVENSPEELAVIAKKPQNYFVWVDKYVKGVKMRERHQCWPREATEELVLAVDFPKYTIDYSKHPASTLETPEVKPLRVDYNGKFKQTFSKTVLNDVNYSTGRFGDSDIKYKIASACGILDTYINDQHDLAHLVQATCNWTLRMTKNVDGDKTYYNTEILNPTAIQDVQERAGVFTVQQQIDELGAVPEFCGILFDGGDYSNVNLSQVRDFWWTQAQRSVQFDRNKGTARTGEWLVGRNWKDSDLAKAYYAYKGETPPQESNHAPETPVQEAPKQVPPEEAKPVESAPAVEYQTGNADNFDKEFTEDDIPF